MSHKKKARSLAAGFLLPPYIMGIPPETHYKTCTRCGTVTTDETMVRCINCGHHYQSGFDDPGDTQRGLHNLVTDDATDVARMGRYEERWHSIPAANQMPSPARPTLLVQRLLGSSRLWFSAVVRRRSS